MKTSFIAVILLVAVLFLGGCGSDPVGAEKTLRISGYTEITITGYRWFSGNDDAYVTEFKARAPNGEMVTGVVTSGVNKGHTIRLD